MNFIPRLPPTKLPVNGKKAEDCPKPSAIFGQLLLKRSLTPAEKSRVAEGRQTALILVVPHAAMLQPIYEALDDWCAEATEILVSETADHQTTDLAPLNSYSGGLPAIHICVSLEHVPRPFLQLADRVVHVGVPDATMVRKVLRRCAIGAVPRDIADLDFSSVAFLPLCYAIGRGNRVRHIAPALRRLAKKTSRSLEELDGELPRLEDCFEYGAAREWGIRIRDDLGAARQGKAEFRDIDTGVLLSSPPGYGKTYFARVLAHSCGIKMFRLGAGELFSNDGHLHSVLATMRTLFSEAERAAPSLVLLDEVDTFSLRSKSDSNSSFFVAVVNELSVLLDRVVGAGTGVIVVGATNRLDAVDPALTRPGRLSSHILIELPDQRGLAHVLKTQTRRDITAAECETLAKIGCGAPPAMIMQWVKLARSAATAAGRPLRSSDIADQIQAGDHRSFEEQWRIAIHECGHVLAALSAKHLGLGVDHVSIVNGSAASASATIRCNAGAMTRQTIQALATMYLAGRAAEEVIFGTITTGAGGGTGSDLHIATHLVGQMHASCGLGDSLLWRGGPDDIIELITRDMNFASLVEQDLGHLYAQTLATIETQKRQLLHLACHLVRHKVMSGDEVHRVLRQSAS